MTTTVTSIKLTHAQVVALGPCSLGKIPPYGLQKTMTASQALNAGATVDDILWVAGRLGRRDLVVQCALKFAERVAHLNTDPRVEAALQATRDYLRVTADPASSPADIRRVKDAAYAAANAVYVAANATAYAAANAAYAAAYAANAAANAANAVYVAANAVYVAANATAYAAANAAYAATSARKAEIEAQKRILIEVFG